MLLDADAELSKRNYYEYSAVRAPVSGSLQESITADVLVIGAGFTGLSCAIDLAQRGYSVVVLEASRVCAGASGRNGGQAIVGYASGQEPFEKQLGKAQARVAWDMSLEALDLIDARIAEFGIDCDRQNGYLYVADSPRKAKALERDMQHLHTCYGFESEFARGTQVQRYIDSPRYCAVAWEGKSGHLHPLKYGLGLARAARALGVRIFENSPVHALQRHPHLVASTPLGQVTATFGVLAGNCMLAEHGAQIAPEISARIMPVGTYIAGTRPLDPALCQRLIPSNAAVSDNNFVLDYFRFSTDHRLLFGGRVSYSTRTPQNLSQSMRERMLKVFPGLTDAEIEFLWGGFVDISMNRAPDFGRLCQNLYYLQGFSGHGVALAGLAGRVLAQSIAGQSERFDVFSRLQHHNFPGGPMLRTPSLVLGMLYHRLRDLF